MAPVCINRGSTFSVNMTLRSIMFLVSITLFSTILTFMAYNGQRSIKNDLCSNYGVIDGRDSTGTFVLSIITTVFGILTISSLYRNISGKYTKFWDWALPLTYLMITIILVIVTVFAVPKENDNSYTVDNIASKWCQDNKDSMRTMGIISSVVLGLTVGGVMSFMSVVLKERCIL